MVALKAEYLGESGTGIKVHSKFLANCDALSTFEKLKLQSVSKLTAPFFIDLYEPETSTNIETIGVSEATYNHVTGEAVMSPEYYDRESQFNEDLLFGELEKQLRDKGKILLEESDSIGAAALRLHKFKQSDHVMLEMNVDDLELTPNTENQ
jgi:hypothetical protein